MSYQPNRERISNSAFRALARAKAGIGPAEEGHHKAVDSPGAEVLKEGLAGRTGVRTLRTEVLLTKLARAKARNALPSGPPPQGYQQPYGAPPQGQYPPQQGQYPPPQGYPPYGGSID
jgi:hypothetical protein